MNSHMRDIWYPRIVKKHGSSNCRGCGKTVFKDKEPKAILDHINNKFVNTEENLQILCRSCNRIKNPRKKSMLQHATTYSQMKNIKTEQKLRGWIFKEIAERNGQWEYEDAKNSSAEKFNCSPETSRKYINKLISSQGPLELVDGYLVFKTNETVDQWVYDEDLEVEQRQ